MSKTMYDSAAAPTLAVAQEAKRDGVDVWGFYVGGSGAVRVWQPEDIAILKSAGITEGVPIYAPDLSLDDPTSWFKQAVAGCKALGVLPNCLALDTEKVEQGNANLHTDIDRWVSACLNQDIDPIVYGGGGYYGESYEWIPAWTLNGTVPGIGTTDAQQYIGNKNVNGVLVDVSIAGDDFPVSSLLETVPVFRATFPELVVGSVGPYVAFLLGFLTSADHYAMAKGQHPLFGDNVENAVRAYQSTAGLPSDGIVGVKTWESLVSSSFTNTVPVGTTDAPVADAPVVPLTASESQYPTQEPLPPTEAPPVPTQPQTPEA